MAYFKEIVTKAVIGKGKKTTKEKFDVKINEGIDNVLGCWVINHNFTGVIDNNNIIVSGNYDVNIWYSYDNNTKTNVVIKTFSYNDPMKVKIKENSKLTNNSEIIVRTLNQPSVTDVEIVDGIVNLVIEKQMGVEVIGDTKVRVSVQDEFDDYEEIVDEDVEIDTDLNDDYLENK